MPNLSDYTSRIKQQPMVTFSKMFYYLITQIVALNNDKNIACMIFAIPVKLVEKSTVFFGMLWYYKH